MTGECRLSRIIVKRDMCLTAPIHQVNQFYSGCTYVSALFS